MKTRHQLTGQNNNYGVDDKQEKAKREQGNGNGEQRENWFHHGVEKGQNERHQQGRKIIVDVNVRNNMRYNKYSNSREEYFK